MSFGWPIALLGLVLVALALIAYIVVQHRRRRYVVRFTNFDLLENIVADSPRWRRHIPAAFALLALTALVIGMARPQVAVAVAREEATVILAMDSSGSMTATDVELCLANYERLKPQTAELVVRHVGAASMIRIARAAVTGRCSRIISSRSRTASI